MLAEISAFRGHVFSGGYKCQDSTFRGDTFRSVVPKWFDDDPEEEASVHPAEGQTVAEDDFIEEKGNLIERYPLEEEPGLYRAFASLELTEQAILEFANKWGPLENAHELDPDEYADTMVAYVGDRLASWFTEINRMKVLVELWDVLTGNKRRKLSDVVEVKTWEQLASWWVDIVFKNAPELRWDFHIHDRDWPGFSDPPEMAEKRELARMSLMDLVNDSLWGSCSPWLRMGEQPGEVTLCFTPHNLIGAFWLSFAQEILGEKTLKQCMYCKRSFEVSRDGNERRQRSDKKYCSPKCRAAAFKDRHSGQA